MEKEREVGYQIEKGYIIPKRKKIRLDYIIIQITCLLLMGLSRIRYLTRNMRKTHNFYNRKHIIRFSNDVGNQLIQETL